MSAIPTNYQVFEVPTQPGSPQQQVIPLAGTTYTLLLYWCDPDGVWMLNIMDTTGDPIVSGLPLITGADMLEQYAYLGIGGMLLAQSDFDWTVPPGLNTLGTTGHLYFIPTTPAPVHRPGLLSTGPNSILYPLAPIPETMGPPGFTVPQPTGPSGTTGSTGPAPAVIVYSVRTVVAGYEGPLIQIGGADFYAVTPGEVNSPLDPSTPSGSVTVWYDQGPFSIHVYPYAAFAFNTPGFDPDRNNSTFGVDFGSQNSALTSFPGGYASGPSFSGVGATMIVVRLPSKS